MSLTKYLIIKILNLFNKMIYYIKNGRLLRLLSDSLKIPNLWVFYAFLAET